MGGIIPFKPETSKTQGENIGSLLSCLIHGTPYRRRIFGKTFQMIGASYLYNKRKEFFEDYWLEFRRRLPDMLPNMEFNPNHLINKYNCLSSLEKLAVSMEISEIYAFENRLTYAAFADVVNEYSKRGLDDTDPDDFPRGRVA